MKDYTENQIENAVLLYVKSMDRDTLEAIVFDNAYNYLRKSASQDELELFMEGELDL